jgi:hypothetical protein
MAFLIKFKDKFALQSKEQLWIKYYG